MRQPNGYNYASSLPAHEGRVEAAKQLFSSLQRQLHLAIDQEYEQKVIDRLTHELTAAEMVFEHQKGIAHLIETGREELVEKLAS